MSKKLKRLPITICIIAFALNLIFWIAIDAPSPILASIVVGFMFFEIGYYHLFVKEKQGEKFL